MKKFLTLMALLLIGATPSRADVRPVEDSYTISQRYEGYKDKYSGLTLPKSEFQAGQSVLFDRRYKTDGNRELHIDIFLPSPKRAKHQGILLVHGGGWRSGDKSHFYALANLLAQRGYAVFLPEYRLSVESRYPQGLIDVNDAIVWVKANAAEFDIPKDKLAIGGASSGGQMASLLAYTADTPLFKTTPDEDTRVNALIDLDGVLDFTTPLALSYENAPGSVASQWLGGSMEQIPDTWREASAAKHVSANSPPTLIISSGLLRFTAGREDVAAALNGYGIRNQYFAFSGAPHDIWLFEPYLSQIVQKIDLFLSNGK